MNHQNFFMLVIDQNYNFFGGSAFILMDFRMMQLMLGASFSEDL